MDITKMITAGVREHFSEISCKLNTYVLNFDGLELNRTIADYIMG